MRNALRSSCALAVIALVLALPGCGSRTDTSADSRSVRQLDLGQVNLEQSTAGEVERLFGAPDERAPDGAFTYRGIMVRGGGVNEPETVTFRFTGGVLSGICRSRS